jgi:dynein heavy chain
VISYYAGNQLLENLRECNKLLELVQNGLSETKRMAFPCLSDDESLKIPRLSSLTSGSALRTLPG